MKPALLDVNVLLALAWPNHQHHAAAHRWFRGEARHGWATCSLTQLAFIRLSANLAYTVEAVSPSAAAALLHRYCEHPRHQFWESPPAADPGLYQRALGHQQVNDAWLIALARQRGGRLVTFDAPVQIHDVDGILVEVLPG
jgi:toxin-antitoxin system PIN domain toxin